MTRRRAVRSAWVWLVVLVACASCGVRSDGQPRSLPAADVPFGLLEAVASTTTTAPPSAVAKESVFVFFVNGGRMFPVVRQVNAPASVPKSLNALLFGTQEDESSQGLRSAINPATSLQARTVDAATVLVDLSAEFVQGSTSEQVLGLAQIVYTATGVPGVTGVRFTLNGAPVEVPTPAGGLTSEPVGREAFADFAPVPPGIEPPG